MNDCPNAAMRDLLPDLLYDRLTAAVRAEVTLHVAGCTDCREELELIRSLQSIVTVEAPRVDVTYVVNALPKPPRRGVNRDVKPIAVGRRTWADWRIAAAVTLIAVGGSSAALLKREPQVLVPVTGPPIVRDTQGVTPVQTPVVSSTPNTQTVATTVPAEKAEVALVGDGPLADLDDAQLEALIEEIEQMKAVPITEPEPVLIRVNARNTSGSGEL
jgi:hypothetical protein